MRDFAENMDAEHVHEVTHQMIAKYILGMPYKPVTKRHYRRSIGGTYAWWVEQGWAMDNPAKKVRTPEVVTPEPGILTVKETEAQPATDMAAASQGCGAAPYCRRHPEQTVLYQVVQQHLETYLALAGEDDWDGQRVGAYVEREFRHYLECGILAYGFPRARCPDCGHDFLVAFSCKGRGLCPSCNARRMAETAAHLVDHVFPPLPVRQWVLSVPKRLRWYLEREPRAVSAVLHILLRVIEAHLCRSSDASWQARFGTVSFIHRFGASLNQHIHDHCCVIDGVFEPVEETGAAPQSARFRPAASLTPEALAAIAEQVRVRVLRWFGRSGLIEPDDVREMLAWENSGFSLDAAVRVGAHDRAGLERLLRDCARPPFALERLELIDEQQVIDRLPRTQRDGTTALTLTPLELIDHLAALIPPPRPSDSRATSATWCRATMSPAP